MRTYYSLLVCALIIATSVQSIFGQIWERLPGPVGATIVTAIITRDKGEIFCYTSTGKLFYSADKGKTWENYSNGLIDKNAPYGSKLKESPIGEVFLCTEKEFYKWQPKTKLWLKIDSSLDEIRDYNFSPDGQTIYSGSLNNFYLFNMASGAQSSQSWWTHDVEFLCLGKNQNFVRKTLGASGAIWKFDDDGSNLRKISNSSSSRNLFFHEASNTLFDYDYNMYVSSDFGQTWTQRILPPGVYINKLVLLKNGTLMGIGQSVYRSIDGGINWVKDPDYAIEELKNVYFQTGVSNSNEDDIVFDFGAYACYWNAQGTLNNIELPLVEPNISSFQQIGRNHLLCQTDKNLQISSNGGYEWNKLGIYQNNELYLWEDGTLMFLIRDTMHFSNDNFKTTFKKVLPDMLPLNLFKNMQGHLIYISAVNTYISYDKGDSWNFIGKHSDFPLLSNLKLSRQNILYALNFSDTIYYSFDYGLSWNKFFAEGADDVTFEIVLTRNNVFWWFALDGNFEYHWMYTTDFGKTTHRFEITNDERFLYLDEFENIYTLTGDPPNFSIHVSNVLSQEINEISLRDVFVDNNSNIRLYRGDNDTLYASINNAPLYKYTKKMSSASGQFSGTVFNDDNLDCIRDTMENAAGNFQLVLRENNRSVTVPVSPTGTFKSYVIPGNYTVHLKSPSVIWTPCNFPAQVNIKVNQVTQNENLLVQAKEQCADLFPSFVLGTLRRCFDNNSATFKIRNEGSASAFNTRVSITFDDYFENIQASIPPNSMQGRDWTFIIPELKPGNAAQINFQFKVSCTASLGQEHCIRYWIDNPQECKGLLPIRDSILICDTNRGAFDPNDKTAYVGGKSAESFQAKDSVLHYLIRFQNTGTDTAFTVRIVDKLDYALDWSSFSPIDGSHPYTYSLDEDGNLEIIFKDIQLPDSTLNEQHSHGYFLYSIQPKKGLRVGSFIHNTAGIYFDFNEPIMTKVAILRLKQTTGVTDYDAHSTQILIAVPNPMNQFADIYIPQDWQFQRIAGSLNSADGRTIQKFTGLNRQFRIERNDLPVGLYYLQLQDDKGNRAIAKIVFE